jgi:hypothetical protein
MPYTNVDYFEKNAIKVFQKSLGATEFYEKWIKKISLESMYIIFMTKYNFQNGNK